MRRAIVLVAFLGVLAAACTKVETQREPSAPDRVVGIELKCDLFTYELSPFAAHVWEYVGWDACEAVKRNPLDGSVPSGWGNLRKELTIQSSNGDTFKVSYGAEHDVWLGMEWPPK